VAPPRNNKHPLTPKEVFGLSPCIYELNCVIKETGLFGFHTSGHLYVKELKKHGIIRSMSRKGNCWDNACAETFFSTIKSERLYHRTYRNIEEARQDIFWYIECFYNRQRRHQALGNITPAAFLKQYYLSQEAAV